MLAYTSRVWQYRYFWGSLVRMDMRNRYRGSLLGASWTLLHPLAMSALLCFVFSKLFGRSIEDFLPTLMSGFVFWQFLTQCTVGGASCLTKGEGFLRQVPAPMAIYPLRTALVAMSHLMIAMAIVFVGNAALNGLQYPGSVLSLLPVLPILVVFGWSLAVLSGFANAYFPDMHHMLEIGMRMLFYATPVIYPPDIMRARGLGLFMDLNPLASVVAVVRGALLGRGLATPYEYAVTASLVIITFTLAILTLNKLERRVIFRL